MVSTGDRRLAATIGSIHFAQHVFRILPPVLPLLARAFPYPLWQLGGLVSVYFAGSGLGQTPAGVLADRYDRRLVVPPGVALMGLGYVVVALGPSLVSDAGVLLLAGRRFTAGYLLMATGTFLAGLGASTIHPAGYPLVMANAATETGGRALGVWNSAAKFGDAAAPLAVALLVLVTDWRGVFLVFGALGVGYAGWLHRLMSGDRIETRPGGRRGDDAPGAAAAATDPDAPGGRDERTPPADPSFPDASTDVDADAAPDATDRRRYVYPMAALLVFFVARAFSEKGLKAFLPTFITGTYGYSFTVAGMYVPPESFADLYFTAIFVVAALTTLVTGRLVDRHDPRAVLIGFFAVAALALAVLATGTLSPLALLFVLAVLGVSNWGWTPARDAIIGGFAPADREGRTFGYLHTVSHLFGAVAPVAIGAGAERLGFRRSFLVLVVVMLVAVTAIASLYSRRVYRRVPRERGEARSVDADDGE
ncbi:MAG: MFS transporter [Haloferacaceae archaeon]